MSQQTDLAKYVLALEHCSVTTSRAEDRPLYAALLADAAGLLAAAVLPNSLASIAPRISSHERLHGQLWLQDPVITEVLAAWAIAKKPFGGQAI